MEEDNVLKAHADMVQSILRAVSPSSDSYRKKKKVYEPINTCIKRVLKEYRCPFEVVEYGSLATRTFLPDGDIDIGIILQNRDASASNRNGFQLILKKLLLRIAKALKDSKEVEVSEITFVDAKLKTIRVSGEHLRADITVLKNSSALARVCAIESIDRIFFDKCGRHIFKEYVLLIKLLFTYELRAFGAANGFLSSYALEILVLKILNCFWKDVQNPTLFLRFFFKFYSRFPWHTHCVNIYNDIPVFSIKKVPYLSFKSNGSQQYVIMPQLFINHGVHENTIYIAGCMNIVDPLNPSNNVGRSVNPNTLSRLQSLLCHSHQLFESTFNSKENFKLDIPDLKMKIKNTIFPRSAIVIQMTGKKIEEIDSTGESREEDRTVCDEWDEVDYSRIRILTARRRTIDNFFFGSMKKK